jgi:SAM-dependent methyltransferase
MGMPNNHAMWDLYWEVRLSAIEDLGKREAILEASRLIRGLAETPGQTARMLELGCGEGQIIGALLEAHAQASGIQSSVGVDYRRGAIETCRRLYPGMRFVEGDFTDPALLAGLGQFEIVLLVNALHEVFSATFSPELGEVDVPAAKARVHQALRGAVGCLAPGGWMVLFDGLEPPGNGQEAVCIRFQGWQARRRFETFAREYKPFRIGYRETGEAGCVELSWHDFARYIDKSIFLGKALWQTERLESYQYFTEDEFRQALTDLGLTIHELRTLTVNYEKWQAEVEILTPGVDFPAEHILILARLNSKNE